MSEKIGVDRVALLQSYEQVSGVPQVPQSDASAVSDAAPTDSASNLSGSEAHPAGEASEKAPAEAAAVGEVVVPNGEVKEEPKTVDGKTVPKEALDAERSKRKEKALEARRFAEERDAAVKERDSAREELNKLREENQRMSAVIRGEAVSAEENEETKKLAEENRKLRAEQAKASQEAQEREQKRQAEEVQAKIRATDEALTAEGFPGFDKFKAEVGAILQQQVNEGDLDPKDVTEETWKHVYRQQVFPQYRSMFEGAIKQGRLDKKTAEKKAASLVGNPGSKPEISDEDGSRTPVTEESYLNARKRIL
jgi:hypothetical protein